MKKRPPVSNIRREYGASTLEESQVSADPILQFEAWLHDTVQSELHDPTAMVLSTVDAQGFPDSRVVLLKGIEAGCFVFYTNYESNKGLQIEHNPKVALNFYWPSLARQVRIRGIIEKIATQQSDEYFASRPYSSQLSALLSPQSRVLSERADLLERFELHLKKQSPLKRPAHWGGYLVKPIEIEFWQGRDNLYMTEFNIFSKIQNGVFVA